MTMTKLYTSMSAMAKLPTYVEMTTKPHTPTHVTVRLPVASVPLAVSSKCCFGTAASPICCLGAIRLSVYLERISKPYVFAKMQS